MIIQSFILAFCTINIIVTIFCSKKILNAVNKKEISQAPQPENDIHSILNNRLIDLQSRRYSVQSKNFRKKDGT